MVGSPSPAADNANPHNRSSLYTPQDAVMFQKYNSACKKLYLMM
jgi:hypothetical protein